MKNANHYGMDTISTASTLACRREITQQDFTPEKLLSLIDDIAMGNGEGKNLGLGASAYAAKMGAPHTAMAVKGMELPAYDPRGAHGMALGYALSTRGGCHFARLSHQP